MLTKVSRTFRLPLGLSKQYDSICVRHGDATWHIEQALIAYMANYAPFKAPDRSEPVKANKPAKRFVKPTLYELQQQFSDKGSQACIDDAQAFTDHYESNGWKVGKNPMKNWKAAVNNWMRNKKSGQQGATGMLGTDISDLIAPEVKSDTSDVLEFMAKNQVIKAGK